MSYVVIYTTFPDIQSAKKITDGLLKSRMVVCSNLFEVDSAFWNKGKLEKSKEIAAYLKTKKENWLKVQKEILRQHPYEIPDITKYSADAHSAYESWIKKEAK